MASTTSSSSDQGIILPIANQVFNRFLNWRPQGVDEDETWKNRAFATLEKKLKKKNDGSYEAFFKVALEQKNPNTRCVTLDRSQDGRIQVSHKKLLPHVMTCKIARWPDLQTHQELKSIDLCNYPGNMKSLSKVCINPYHYQRVDQPIYPPILPQVQPALSGFPQSPASFAPSPSSLPSVQNGQYYAPPAGISPRSSFNGSQSSFMYQNNLHLIDSPPPPSSVQTFHSDMETDERLHLNTYSPGMVSCVYTSNIWCKITYWEMSTRVGEPFSARTQTIFVDGFTAPTNHIQRYSLGSLYNINRNEVIKITRKAIGKGAKFEKTDSGIWAVNLSTKPLFFHSRNHNAAHSKEIHNPLTVIRVDPKEHIKIFDDEVFKEQVRQAMESPENSYDKVMSLNSHCSVKMSFVKGWGAEYHRLEVTSTPCWLDITLCEPLSYLDSKLKEIGSPTFHVTSTS